MTSGSLLGFGISVLLLHPIHTDFKMDAQAPVAANPPAITTEQQPENKAVGRRTIPRPKVPLALGFGHDVPLSFAVQQVVPRYMTVNYGDTVDQQIRVTWEGGRPWPQVLMTVLDPIGLHMHISGRKILISD